MERRILKVALPTLLTEELGGMKHISLKGEEDLTAGGLKEMVVSKLNLKLNARRDISARQTSHAVDPANFEIHVASGKADESQAKALADDAKLGEALNLAGGRSYHLFLVETARGDRMDDDIFQEGWLSWQNPKAKSGKTWQRTYFVLYKDRICAMPSEENKRGTPTVELSLMGEGCHTKEDNDKKWNRAFAFSLEPATEEASIPFASDSELETRRWLNAIIGCLSICGSRGVSAILSGWMWKKSRRREQQWKKRYFVLRSDRTLRYFRNERTGAHNGEVELSDNSSVNSNPTLPKAPPTSHMFLLQAMPHKAPLYLACPTEPEKNEWIRAISEQITVFVDIQRNAEHHKLDMERRKMHRQIERERQALKKEIVLEQAEARRKLQEELQTAKKQLERLVEEKKELQMTNREERERRATERSELLKKQEAELAKWKADAPESVKALEKDMLALQAEVELEKQRIAKEKEAEMKVLADEKQKVIEDKELQLEQARVALRRAETDRIQALNAQQAESKRRRQSVNELDNIKDKMSEADSVLQEREQRLRELEMELEEDRRRLAELEEDAGLDKKDVLLMTMARGLVADKSSLPNVADMLRKLLTQAPRQEHYPYLQGEAGTYQHVQYPDDSDSSDGDSLSSEDEAYRAQGPYGGPHGGMRVNPGFDEAVALGGGLGTCVMQAVQKELLNAGDGISIKTQGRVVKLVPTRSSKDRKKRYAYELWNDIYLAVTTRTPRHPLMDHFTVKTTVHLRPEPETPTNNNGPWLRYSAVSRVGYDASDSSKKNQDRTLEVQCFDNDPKQSLFGVFDGHGQAGHEVSNYLVDNLPGFIIQGMAARPGRKKLKNVIRRAFIDCNNELNRRAKFDIDFSGSTGIVCYVNGNTVLACNVGDSRAIFATVKKGKLVPVPLSRDHKPEEADEAKRIWQEGGRVMAPPGSEDWDPMNPNIPAPALRVWLKDEDIPGLGMTRSFGDYICHTVGVISDPEVWEKTIDADTHFMVIASDGVWEFMTNQEVIDIVAAAESPDAACHALVDMSTTYWLQEGGYVDDISAVVVYFKSPEECIKLNANGKVVK